MTEIRCPVCEKRFEVEGCETMPFCSPRCRDIDLNRWLAEDYGMPYEPEDETPEAESQGRHECI